MSFYTTVLILLEYNITLWQADLPCVNVGTREKAILLPPELATVLPGQSFKGKLLDEQTREMITYACRRPKQNAESIVGEGLSILGLKPPSQLLVCIFNNLYGVY